MIELDITVDGMSSRKRASEMKRLVRRFARVRRVAASYTLGECRVISREPVDKDALAEEMEKIGIFAVGFIEKPYERRPLFRRNVK